MAEATLQGSVADTSATLQVSVADTQATLTCSVADTQAMLLVSVAFLTTNTATALPTGNLVSVSYTLGSTTNSVGLLWDKIIIFGKDPLRGISIA